jgi:hypothetical protein
MSLTAIEFFLGPLPQVIALSVVAVVGSIFAIRRRKSQPMASRLVIIGFCAIFINVVGVIVIAAAVFADRSLTRISNSSDALPPDCQLYPARQRTFATGSFGVAMS